MSIFLWSILMARSRAYYPSRDFTGASYANRNPVQKDRQYFVPDPDKSFRLDHNTGEESLYFIASRQPDTVLDQKYHKLSVAQQTQAIESVTLIQEQLIVEFKNNEKQRLIDPELITDNASTEETISFQEAGQRFSVLPSYLNNLCEGCVYRVTFKHF
jgi:protease II